MKTYKIIPAAIFLVFFTAINTFASTIYYIGTFDGNDPSNSSADLSELEKAVSSWLKLNYNINLEFYAKVEDSSDITTEGTGVLSLKYTLSDDGESRSGTWYADDAISLFSVKAGNGYALYWVDQTATSGTWDTSALDDKGISHFSAWVVTSPTLMVTSTEMPIVYPNPEPATMLLFGLGLLGLARISRKKS